MTVDEDQHFWDGTADKYSTSKVGDQAGYERTLDRSRSFLSKDDHVLELGCGTGSTALLLASSVGRYLATDLSPKMIRIAQEKLTANPALTGLEFRATTADALSTEASSYKVILGFNYLHLVRDTPATMQSIRALLDDGGLFISKTPCLGEMNPLIRWLALPVMQRFGWAPYAGSFTAAELREHIVSAGFEILADEMHSSKGNDRRPFIVARKR
ncbi:hypothetical protein LLEC1_03901 [Akanthomyces lecanii]|uniref:Methyltransferase type 12 domain-containing protein n=1 Tax=Cordyceps confragosa TaxID=2714763 RepID=A0A179I5X6_CORDF|nr:hypothetical protein LLEC1_03901 [Akanthomyces lecanii]